MANENSIITDAALQELLPEWRKLITALNKFETAPLLALQALLEFSNAKTVCFTKYNVPLSAESTAALLNTLILHPPLITQAHLFKLEQLNISLSDFLNAYRKTPGRTVLTDAVSYTLTECSLIFDRVISSHCTKYNILQTGRPRISNQQNFKLINEFFKQELQKKVEKVEKVEKEINGYIKEINDFTRAATIALSPLALAHLNNTNKAKIESEIHVSRISIEEKLNQLWTGPSSAEFILTLDSNPNLAKQFYEAQHKLTTLSQQSSYPKKIPSYRNNEAYKLRMAKHETEKLIHSKNNWHSLQSSQNKTLLNTTSSEVKNATALSEVATQLQKIQDEYQPRDQMFSFIHKIKSFLGLETKKKETETYKQADRIRSTYGMNRTR